MKKEDLVAAAERMIAIEDAIERDSVRSPGPLGDVEFYSIMQGVHEHAATKYARKRDRIVGSVPPMRDVVLSWVGVASVGVLTFASPSWNWGIVAMWLLLLFIAVSNVAAHVRRRKLASLRRGA